MALATSTHDALVLSSAGGSPRVATVTVSPHAQHRSYNYPRSLDLSPFNHLTHVNEISLDGEVYCMYYVLAPCMPINRTVLEILGLRDVPQGRLMYRGDIFLLKIKGPSERDICDRCYDNATRSILSKLKPRIQYVWQHKLLESELCDMKQLVSNPGSRREFSDEDFDNLVEEVREIERFFKASKALPPAVSPARPSQETLTEGENMEEEKMFELLTSVKNMVKSDPTQARTALASHPNLAYALMKEMVVLDIVDPEVLTRTLQAATGAQPQQSQPPQPAPQQSYPHSNGTASYPPYLAPGSTPTYVNPSQPTPYQQPPSSTPSYSTPTYPSTTTPAYPPPSAPPYPPSSTPSYPNYPPQQAQTQPPAPSVPPHAYQARQQPQQQPQQQPPMQSRAPPPMPAIGMGPVPGLAPEQQAMVQRLALLTPDQIAALPPADRVALIELRRQLGLE